MISSSTTVRAFTAAALLALSACGSVVSPGYDAGRDRVYSSEEHAPVCRTPDGGVLFVGGSYQVDCNTCRCELTGVLECTGRACVDSGPPSCTAATPCGPGSSCFGPPGCSTPWTCQPQRGCTADVSPFCSCAGVTVYGSSSCPPEPYQHTGPCEMLDAGNECVGAFLTPTGLCLGPVDQVLPAYCCGDVDAGFTDATGAVDCNPAHVLCDVLPPPCPAGQVRSVIGGCWGVCVSYTVCEAIACDPSAPPGQCPAGLTCWRSGVCGPYVR